MIFIADTAFALELIALALGGAFLVWSLQAERGGTKLAKVFGWIIVVLSALALACTSYYSLKYWEDGYYKEPYMKGAHYKRGQHMMQDMPMMHGMPMMQGMQDGKGMPGMRGKPGQKMKMMNQNQMMPKPSAQDGQDQNEAQVE